MDYGASKKKGRRPKSTKMDSEEADKREWSTKVMKEMDVQKEGDRGTREVMAAEGGYGPYGARWGSTTLRIANADAPG